VKPAGLLDDLHAFDPATMTWTNLSVADDTGRPSARSNHGFTSAGGLMYVHGGISKDVGEWDEEGPSVELKKGGNLKEEKILS
jgi:hypothetical protein